LELFKLLTTIFKKLKRQPKTSSCNIKNKNSSGKKPFKPTLLLSLSKEKTQGKRFTRESMLMEKRKKMKPSNGWLIRF